MSSEKYKELVDRLFDKTETGKLEWRETAEPDAVQVSFSNYSIMLSQRKDPLRVWDYVVTVGISDSEGKAYPAVSGRLNI